MVKKNFKFDKNKLLMDLHFKLSRKLTNRHIYELQFLIAVTQCYNQKEID